MKYYLGKTYINLIKSELKKGEEEINNELNSFNGIQKEYRKYGLLNNKWLEDFKLFLKNPSSYNNMNKLFTYNNLTPKIDKKDYSYVGKGYGFSFPCDFIIVTEKLMLLISNYFKKEEQNKIKKFLFEIMIGSQCTFMKIFNCKNINN